MPATLKGTSGLVWGCTSETAGLIQNLRVVDSVDKAYVRNHEGEVVGKSMYNRHQALTLTFYFTGSASGLGAIDPAEVPTIAGYTPSAGIVTADEVTTTTDNQDYKKVDVALEVFPLITS